MTLADIVKKGATDRSVTVKIIDSGDGTPETGVVFNTAGIDLWYRREGAAKVSITEATLSALTDAHSDGGFLHVSDGVYRLDLPDAAFATGANYVDFGGTVTGMIVMGGRVRLVNIDLEDVVRAGLTALPNAAADAAGGLPISDAGGLDLDLIGSKTGALPSDPADASVIAGLIDAIPTAAEILAEIRAAQRSGTAQAGAAGTITLDAGASAADDFYRDAIVVIVAGTGAGQARMISGYVGATKVASVSPNWVVNPNNTSVFIIVAQ